MQVLVIGAAAVFDHIFPVLELPSKGRVAQVLATPSLEGHTYYGGTAFNIAVTMARLGVTCGVMHAVGQDFPGSNYERWLKDQGVSLEGLQVHKGHLSGHAFLFHDPEGETLCFSSAGAAEEPLELESSAALVSQVEMLVIAPVFGPPAARLLELAVEHSVQVAACGILSAGFARLLSGVDILITNRYESERLCEAEHTDDPRELLKKGPALIYETHGTRGSRLLSPEGERWIAITPPQASVDPTGAGDAYCGAVLAGILRGLDPAQAGLAGSVAASFVVEQNGCQTNLPDWSMVHARHKDCFRQDSLEWPA